MVKESRPTVRFVDRLVRLVAWSVTCGVVYVLGYYVGKNSVDHHTLVEERAVRLPVTSAPPPEGQRPKETTDFPTFYQALPAGDRPIDVARGTTVTIPVVPTLPAVAPLPPTTLARVTTTTLPAGQPTTTRPAPTASTTLVRVLAVPATTLPRATLTPTTVPPSNPPVTPPRPAARGGFTVEASPTRSRTEAEQLLTSLRRRGYDATLVQVQRDGDVWYRLRVGRYGTSEQATEAMRRLRDVEGVTHVFVAAE